MNRETFAYCKASHISKSMVKSYILLLCLQRIRSSCFVWLRINSETMNHCEFGIMPWFGDLPIAIPLTAKGSTTQKHVLSRIQASDPSVQAVQDYRALTSCNWRQSFLLLWIFAVSWTHLCGLNCAELRHSYCRGIDVCIFFTITSVSSLKLSQLGCSAMG
jgi:hypothetical protein